MEKRIYPVKRDDIYAGLVVGEFILDPNYTNLFNEKIEFVSCYNYRSILFTLDENGNAIDLLYNSPLYPVYGYADLETCQSSKTIVKDAKNIGRLLKFYNYNEFLYEDDIKKVVKHLFSESFARDNCEHFGLTRIEPEYIPFYDELGKEIRDPEKIKKLRKDLLKRQKNNEVFFTSSSNYDGLSLEVLESVVLPKEYFNLLVKLGNNSYSDVLRGYASSVYAFKPNKDEGPIRRRKKDQ